MDKDPQVGTQSVCTMCGAPIAFVGPHWDHLGNLKPRHPATPGQVQSAKHPIERTVIWDEAGECWRDKATGVGAKDMPPPTMARDGGVPWDYHGGFGVSYLDEARHPFEKSFAVTYEQVQKMIADAFDQRTAKTQTYFVDLDALVTAGYVREVAARIDREISTLERRAYCLEQPWWKRWFSR